MHLPDSSYLSISLNSEDPNFFSFGVLEDFSVMLGLLMVRALVQLGKALKILSCVYLPFPGTTTILSLDSLCSFSSRRICPVKYHMAECVFNTLV